MRNLLARLGWVLYGFGGKATSSVVFLIGPIMLTNMARLKEAEEEAGQAVGTAALVNLPHLLPTSVPSLAISVALLGQCVAAPLLALVADRYGLRRILMAVHVALGLVCNALLGLVSESAPVAVQASLLAGLYYAMALAWMFQNALLPSVASTQLRPTVSLLGAGVSNVGAGLFLIAQYKLLSEGEIGHAHAPSNRSLANVCLLAAAIWLVTALPSIGLLSTLRAEPLAPEQPAGVGVAAALEVAKAPDRRAVAQQGNGSGSEPAVRVGIGGLLHSVERLRRHKHASRFVLAQTLYLTAATADGTNSAVFAQEVVGLPVSRIVRLAIFAALSGAFGSMATAVLARLLGARSTLCLLMSLPPLLLLYTALILDSEIELLYVGTLRAFVAGGVGFHGLNRGVFSQMVPAGHEAEFFGAFFVAIKAFSWVGPLTSALLNELTGSLRKALLSACIFYLPSLLVMALTDFDAAKAEATLAQPHAPNHTKQAPPPARGQAAWAGLYAMNEYGPRARLLKPKDVAPYGGV